MNMNWLASWLAIRRTANHLKADRPRRYSYEEWVEYTRLIRFSSESKEEADIEEEEEALIQWDWIGEDSPMLAEQSESEWLLDRLCENLDRYMKKQVPEYVKHRRKSQVLERMSSSRRGSRADHPPGAIRRKSYVDGVENLEQTAIELMTILPGLWYWSIADGRERLGNHWYIFRVCSGTEFRAGRYRMDYGKHFELRLQCTTRYCCGSSSITAIVESFYVFYIISTSGNSACLLGEIIQHQDPVLRHDIMLAARL
jgi:hypothetical protein